METINFKERAASTATQLFHDFKSVYVDYEYLVCSEAFTQNPYYIVTAKEDNYLHLTGIPFPSPRLFAEKCANGTLTESDISFNKQGHGEKSVKNSIRRKISVLPNLIHLFSAPLAAEELFSKNSLACSFGLGNASCTIGYIVTASDEPRVKPKTLLSGFELNPSKAKEVDLVLCREQGTELFDTLIVGNAETLAKYRDKIADLSSDSLFRNCDLIRNEPDGLDR